MIKKKPVLNARTRFVNSAARMKAAGLGASNTPKTMKPTRKLPKPAPRRRVTSKKAC